MIEKADNGRPGQEKTGEPIAIIGIGCRFPGGANSPAAFWQLLCNGVDAIREIPPDRWNQERFYSPDGSSPGKIKTRWGGFVEQIDQFDAHFFGISPREATRMDPQQRLLLEVAWEALEDSGQVPEELAGSDVGVFIGISAHDYYDIQLSRGERNSIDAYTNLGGYMAITANRISYTFDFHGPSMSIDTGCSASLVALHQACNSLRNKECTMALVGGVNAILKPEMSIGFSKASMLAPDGRCKTFDARANGYVRSEGAGIVVLKPLSSALAERDPIYAVILGSATNQDGRTVGITVPSQAAQVAMLKQAYQRAGVSPGQVSYVEAHGTGTAIGDPIETKALGTVLGQGRVSGNECLIGSVKTNIGHMEAGSGMAGLIKTALALKHRQIPPNLHFQEPNPNISFAELGLRVPQRLEPWPDGVGPAVAGVNSFGFGGANAHVVLREAPKTSRHRHVGASDRAYLAPLSARHPRALKMLAASYREVLIDPSSTESLLLRDIVYTTSQRRNHHDHRLALTVRSKADLVEHLDAFLADEAGAGIAAGKAAAQRPKLVFVFPGMGPQWWGMGRQMLREEPVFRAAIEQCDALFQQYAGWSLLSELTADEAASRMHETEVAQPANFALQVALAALWRHWGIEPDVVMGHSAGEPAAAYVAGVLSLEDAVRVIYHRSRLQQRTTGQGTMAAIGLSAEATEHILEPYADRVSIAAINSPSSVTISGDADALEAIMRALEQRSVFCRLLGVEVPYHSPKMDPLKDDLLAALAVLELRSPATPIYSTVTGDLYNRLDFGADYWWRNVRHPVRFADAVQRIVAALPQSESGQAGIVFMELGPHPVLAQSILECLEFQQRAGAVLPSLRRHEDESACMLRTLGELYIKGASVAWRHIHPDEGDFVRLPTYPWQRERYWQESVASAQDRQMAPSHPLLGDQLPSAVPVWESELSLQALPYLNDHRIQDTVIFPAAGYVEMAITAAQTLFAAESVILEKIDVHQALLLPVDGSVTLQFVIAPDDGAFQIFSRKDSADPHWTRHASGTLRPHTNSTGRNRVSLDDIRARCTEIVTRADCYQALSARGLHYGPNFQGIVTLWRGQTADGPLAEALAHVQLPDSLVMRSEKYQLHPALLDACFQTLLGALAPEYLGSDLLLPTQIAQVRSYGSPRQHMLAHARIRSHDAHSIEGDICLFDDIGNLITEIRGFRLRRMAAERTSAAGDLDNYLYEFRWQLRPLAGYARADFWPAPAAVATAVQPEVTRLSEALARQHYYQAVAPELDALTTTYILDALRQLGWQWHPQQRTTFAALADQLGIIPRYHRLMARLLGMLAEDGFLVPVEGGWEVCSVPNAPQPQAMWERLAAQYPAVQLELAVIGRCGQRLPEVLQGRIDPLPLLFPEQGQTSVADLYRDAPTFCIYNHIARAIVDQVLKTLPRGRVVRILEIGAGTGATTAYLLPQLPANQTEYVFTDVSNLFTLEAAQRFGAYPFVRYQRLDIEQEIEAQGFEPHSFDLILAANVLHATRDLRQTLAHVQQLLAPDGLFACLEVTAPPRWLDIVFGLTEGWWAFTDVDVRPSYLLLSEHQWLSLLDEAGFAAVVSVADSQPGQAALHTWLVARGSRELPYALPIPEQPSLGSWLIFADRDGVGEQLATRLQSRAAQAILISPGDVYRRLDTHRFQVCPSRRDDLLRLFDVMQAEMPPCRGIVHLWSLDVQPGDTTLAHLQEAQLLGCLSVIYLIQGVSHAGWAAPPDLWLVTGGAQAIDGYVETVSIAQAPLWGLGRVLMNEHPDWRCQLVDVSARPNQAEIEALFQEVWSSHTDSGRPHEAEIALRDDNRLANRLVRRRVPQTERVNVSVGRDPFCLVAAKPGVLESLTWHAATRRTPGPGEIEIQVYATGLNFKDVMRAMGMLSDAVLHNTFSGHGLGLECAGRIVAVGAGVEGFAIDDEVVAAAPDCFSGFAITLAALAVPKPPSLTFEEAATIPVTFLTVHYALRELGRLRRGERVLIHSAAGGVGLTAVQLAQHIGAEIFATAGSPEKRAYLRSLGIEHVMDSRSLAFADEIMELTGGQGVDVVLNSLAGDAIDRSLAVLAPYGRFLELGKQDIDKNRKLGLRLFQNNLSFLSFDINRLLYDRPEQAGVLLRSIMQEFEAGHLHPLPHRVYPISAVEDAFRTMAQAKHIGKIVVAMQNQDLAVAPSPDPAPIVRADGTYLITGGLGGFGLVLARWLVRNGARHLVLVGRRGAATPDAEQTLDAMRQTGAQVSVVKADVANPDDVARLLADVRKSMPPLRGVIHTAMVLDDGLLLRLDREQFQRVMAPKVLGAWNLHTQTLDAPLDFFVLFSSANAIYGNPGQGNYAAANTFLDALAHHRRALGLPALAIGWGALAEVGYIARNDEVQRRLEHHGLQGLTPDQVLEILDRSLRQKWVHVGAIRMDWQQWSTFFSTQARSPRFAHLVNEAAGQGAKNATQTAETSLRDTLIAATPAEHRQLLVSYLCEQVARVAGIAADQVDTERSFPHIGLDSLMSVELSNRLKVGLDVDVPVMRLLGDLTIAGLATLINEQLTTADAGSSPRAQDAARKNGDLSTHEEQLGAAPDMALIEGTL